MPADADLASLYTQRYTLAQIAAFLDAALEAVREARTVSRSFQGASMSISPEAAKQTALDLGEAHRLKTAAAAASDGALTAAPMAIGPDFSTRQIR